MKLIEVERKFLLKNLPHIDYDEIHDIEQFYLEDGSRIRQKSKRSKKGSKDSTDWEVTKKTKHSISAANYEDNNPLTEKEYDALKQSATKVIIKTRFIKNIEDGLKWEIDLFKNIHIIIAELEMITQENKIDETYLKLINQPVPDYVKDNMIVEVTGIKKFSNIRLALDMKKIKEPILK